jgi:hypothetical protein
LERILFVVGVGLLVIAIGTSAIVVLWSVIQFVLAIIAGSG